MIFFLSSSSGYTNLRWRNNKPEKINIRILATDSNGNSWRSAFNIILKSHVVGVCLRHLISPSFAVDAVNSSARSALYLSALCWGEFIISATFLANCGHVRGTLQQTQSHFMCFCCCIFVLLLCLFVFFLILFLFIYVWRCGDATISQARDLLFLVLATFHSVTYWTSRGQQPRFAGALVQLCHTISQLTAAVVHVPHANRQSYSKGVFLLYIMCASARNK